MRMSLIFPLLLLGLVSSVGPATANEREDILVAPAAWQSVGSNIWQPNVLTSAEVSADVTSVYGGRVVAGRDRVGRLAFDFPSFSWSSYPGRAVIRLRPVGNSDPMAPGWRDFDFGATIRKDARSSGTVVDNGDNLVQRGLASDSSQFKLEIDGNRPRCSVKGSRGSVGVRAPLLLNSDRWYRVDCQRSGGQVRVVTKEFMPNGGTRLYSAMSTGRIGDVRWSRTETPLAIGGKLAANGSIIRAATDQFNGLLVDPHFSID